jgi:hypothetical protein
MRATCTSLHWVGTRLCTIGIRLCGLAGVLALGYIVLCVYSLAAQALILTSKRRRLYRFDIFMLILICMMSTRECAARLRFPDFYFALK